MTEPNKYSADWIRAEVKRLGATRLDSHNCSICRVMVKHVFIDGEVFFDPNCGCCEWTGLRPSSFDELEDHLARQNSDKIRDDIMRGLR